MKLGEMIRQQREARKLTQEQLAETLHVTRQAVSKWETGNSYPDFETLLVLAKYLNLSLDDIIQQDHQYTEKLKKEQKRMNATDIIGVCLALIGVIEVLWSHTVETPGLTSSGYLSLVLGGLVLICLGLLLIQAIPQAVKIGVLVITTLFSIVVIYSFKMEFFIFLMSAVALAGIGALLIYLFMK